MPKINASELLGNALDYAVAVCQHLQGNKPGEHSCAIHNYEWYKETPCAAFTQVGKDDEPCRVGNNIING